MRSRYPDLPHLTRDEFDELVHAARSREDSYRVISDLAFAIAHAVLIDGLTYRQAAIAHGKSHGTAAHQAVPLLVSYWQSETPVQPHQLCTSCDPTRHVVPDMTGG